MRHQIFITITLFIFSFLFIKSGVYFIRENDRLMKEIKARQDDYYLKPIDAVITKHTTIPGISGRKVNIKKSYQKMKAINEFKESLLVFDEIKPNKTIDNIYDKVIVSGNKKNNKISLITSLDEKYCYTEELFIKKECVQDNKHTILIHKITNLSQVKELIQNGIIFYLKVSSKEELNLIIKYIKSLNYEFVDIKELIKE